MKYIHILIIQLGIIGLSIAQTNPNHVWVNGYHRSNGTYVKGHYRTAPNHTNVDNFSTIGNINPFTYEQGWVKSDGQENPWDDESISTEREYVEIEPYHQTTSYLNTPEKKRTTITTQESSINNDQLWYSKGNQVNVRLSSSTSSNIAFRIDKGDVVNVLSKSEHQDYIVGYGNDRWYEITYDGSTGWVFGKLIGQQNFNTTILKDWNGEIHFINANSVNIRSEPDINIGNVKFQLNKNEVVEILAKTTSKYSVANYGTDYWYYIKAEERTGWVFGGLIKT